MKEQQAGRGKRIAVVVNVLLWVVALVFWPATILSALATGWDTVSEGFLSFHDANFAGLVGFVWLTTLAFAVTVVTLAVAHIRSLRGTSAGGRIAYSVAWLAILAVGSLAVAFVTQMLGLFFILSLFEGLF